MDDYLTEHARDVILEFIQIMNEAGRAASKFLEKELEKEENDEAASWVDILR